MRALRYDYYKGPQYYRNCDHQSVQSVLVIEAKANTARGEADVFDIVGQEGPDERFLRSCEELATRPDAELPARPIGPASLRGAGAGGGVRAARARPVAHLRHAG